MPAIICDIYVISFSEGSIYRRGARRWKKMYYVNGHTFQARRFNRVSIIPFNLSHCTISVHLLFFPLVIPLRPFSHTLAASATHENTYEKPAAETRQQERRSVRSCSPLLEHFQHENLLASDFIVDKESK